MKLSPIFLFLFLLTACATKKRFNPLSPVTKIENQKVYYADGNKGALPINKKQKATTIYLVRHAEKAATGGRDPELTAEGRQRANRLKHILSSAGIEKVYSTDYKRTQFTAKPAADLLGKSVQSYNPRDLPGFAKILKTNHQGETILVVGHSNTTPTLVNALLNAEQYPMIDEMEYGHLFVVTITESGTVASMDLRY